MQTKLETRLEAKRRIALVNDRADLSVRMAKNVLEFLDGLNLQSLKVFSKPLRLGLFLSMSTEIDTGPLIDQLICFPDKYSILVPRVEGATIMHFYEYSDPSEYTISEFGIREPQRAVSNPIVPDIILVPGLAFDQCGGRVGHGKGYYDRYFESYKDLIEYKIALAYDIQIFAAVPMAPYDWRMDAIITDKRVLTF